MTTTLTTSDHTSRDTYAAVARGVVKTYGSGATRVRALDGVDLAIPRGRFTAVMGPSGSGKSTLLHVLAGLDAVDAGSVRLGDLELRGMSEKQLTLVRRAHLGFVFQSFNLVPSLTAEENIALPLRLAGRAVDREWLDHLATVLGIANRLGHRPSELSGGQQQRVAVARSLIARPAIVFADEPTGNLDSRRGHALLSVLASMVRETGQTVVMVTHDPAAAAHADRAVFLSDGRVAGELAMPTIPDILAHMAGLERPAHDTEA